MRDIFKISGIIAMAAVIGFSMISCDDLLTKKEKGTGSSTYDWYRSSGSSSTYTIKNFSQLQELANIVQGNTGSNGPGKSDFSGKTVKLENDIDMNGKAWNGIGNMFYPFNGTFDGNNKTIKNLQMSNSNQGFFGSIGEKGTVKNLTLTGLNVSTPFNDAGGFTYENRGTIQDVKVTGNVSGQSTGGFAVQNYGRIEGCTFSGTVTATSGMTAGGIAYENSGTIRKCTVPKIKSSNDPNVNAYGAYNNGYVTDCSFNNY